MCVLTQIKYLESGERENYSFFILCCFFFFSFFKLVCCHATAFGWIEMDRFGGRSDDEGTEGIGTYLSSNRNWALRTVNMRW